MQNMAKNRRPSPKKTPNTGSRHRRSQSDSSLVLNPVQDSISQADLPQGTQPSQNSLHSPEATKSSIEAFTPSPQNLTPLRAQKGTLNSSRPSRTSGRADPSQLVRSGT